MESLRKRDRVLILLKEGPHKYTELARESGLSWEGLSKALKDLMAAGLIEKLPDGRYVLTEQGKRVVEEFEALELTREAIQVLGVERVKGFLESLMERLEERSVEVKIAELLIRLLRAYTVVTKVEKGVQPWRDVSDEEKRAVKIIHAALVELGGEKWYESFSIFLTPNELARIKGAGKGGEEVWWFPALFLSNSRAIRIAERELSIISTINLKLPATLQEAVDTLLFATKERLWRLKEKEKKD